MRIGLGPVSLARATRAQLADLGEAAVAASFDSFWVAESRSDGFGGGMAAAALLAQLVPIRVGVVLDFGGYHPLHAAEDIAVADVTSNGRIEVLLRGGSTEQRRLLVAALGGAHLRFDGETLHVPARLEANQPASEKLALNPRPAQAVVPIWVDDASLDEARQLGVGVATRWRPGVAAPAQYGRWPGMLLCPREATADQLLRAAGHSPAYFLVEASTADDASASGGRLAGPLRMPDFPDWIGRQ